jgi:hypothetical protein
MICFMKFWTDYFSSIKKQLLYMLLIVSIAGATVLTACFVVPLIPSPSRSEAAGRCAGDCSGARIPDTLMVNPGPSAFADSSLPKEKLQQTDSGSSELPVGNENGSSCPDLLYANFFCLYQPSAASSSGRPVCSESSDTGLHIIRYIHLADGKKPQLVQSDLI